MVSQVWLTARPNRTFPCPGGQAARRTERRIIALRFTRRWGPHRIGYHLHLPQSTVSKGRSHHLPIE
jgi:hypothetical protein